EFRSALWADLSDYGNVCFALDSVYLAGAGERNCPRTFLCGNLRGLSRISSLSCALVRGLGLYPYFFRFQHIAEHDSLYQTRNRRGGRPICRLSAGVSVWLQKPRGLLPWLAVGASQSQSLFN